MMIKNNRFIRISIFTSENGVGLQEWPLAWAMSFYSVNIQFTVIIQYIVTKESCFSLIFTYL